MDAKPFFYDLSFDSLIVFLKQLEIPEFRARQLWQAFYVDLLLGIENVTTLSKELRQTLASVMQFNRLNATNRMVSTDGETVKTLFELVDGKAIEAVLMHYDERKTLCVSSQAGCAMGCVFCATGQMGFARNLSSGEIVEQVLHYARELKQTSQIVTNFVILGM